MPRDAPMIWVWRLLVVGRGQTADEGPPAVEVFLGQAVFADDFVDRLAVRARDRNLDFQSTVRFVTEEDLDLRAGGQTGRNLRDRAFSDFGAIVSRRAFALDDGNENRSLPVALRLVDSPGHAR